MPSLESWRDEVARSLKGRGDESLAWHCDDGFVLPPLLWAGEVAELPHGTVAGQTVRGGRGWRIRERITGARPYDAAAAIAEALAMGVEEIELCFDGFARLGIDPQPSDEDDEDEDRAGWDGIAIYTAPAMREVLDAVDLATTPVVFDAGPASLAALTFLLEHCAARGFEPARLRGELGFDPFDEEDPERSWSDRLTLAGTLLAGASELPGFRSLMLNGRRDHLIGAAAGQELGGIMARAVALMRALGDAGFAPDAIAANLAFRIDISTELLTDCAKLRAARLHWAKIAHAFGVSRVVAAAVPFHAYTSTRCVAQRYDVRTNLLRTTLMATAAVLGGCDALVTEPYELDPDCQTPQARALARQQQLLLRHEAFLGRVADPLAGSYTLERLTHEIGAAGWRCLQEIEAAGGITTAAGEQVQRSESAEAGTLRAGRFRRRERVLIGISRYVDADLESRRGKMVQRAGMHAALCDELAARPENPARDSALQRLADATGAARVTAAREAAAAGATIGEITEAGTPTPQDDGALTVVVDLPAGSDGREFEELRDSAEQAPPFEVLLVTIGDEDQARSRADLARDMLQAAALVVHEASTSGDIVADIAGSHNADIVVLCAADGMLPAALQKAQLGLGTPPTRALAAVGRPAPALETADALIHPGIDVITLADYLTLLCTVRFLRSRNEAEDPGLQERLEQLGEQLAQAAAEDHR